jgi:hypothetical protein
LVVFLWFKEIIYLMDWLFSQAQPKFMVRSAACSRAPEAWVGGGEDTGSDLSQLTRLVIRD